MEKASKNELSKQDFEDYGFEQIMKFNDEYQDLFERLTNIITSEEAYNYNLGHDILQLPGAVISQGKNITDEVLQNGLKGMLTFIDANPDYSSEHLGGIMHEVFNAYDMNELLEELFD